VIVLVLFTVIAARLVQLQMVDGQAYAAEALKQRLTPVTLLASRGSILDANGVALARSAEARYVYADPTMVKDRDATAAKLSPLLGVPRSKLVAEMKPSRLANGVPQRFVYLARGVDIPTGDRVEALDLPGIGVRPDQTRQVAGHDLAANLIGYTGWDQSGLAGLESEYNSLLKGTDGKSVYEAGPDGQEIPNGYHHTTAAKDGSSLQLTIDSDVQFEAQQALYEKLHGTGADMGAAVVLDVKTGAVVAQASYPGYDAGNPAASTAAQRVDQASQSVVEPGSIEKAITIGAALDKGVIKPSSTFKIPYTIYKGGVAFPDAYWHQDGVEITVPGIFAYSSDVGTITVADKLGAQNLYDYQKLFGLGQPTGEGMPAEASGIVQPPSNWSASSYGSVPIGYSVAVTPIQMAAAYLAIANDGEYIQPHLVEDTIAPDGTKTPAPAPKKHRVMSPKVAQEERQAMISTTTVQKATAVKAAIPGYLTAGKTGTGQRVVNNHYQAGNVESFIGMTPANNPRYVVAVFEHGGNGEGENMTPVFKDIMSFTLGHFGVPPDGDKAPDFHVYVGQ
jgi:cell division protein FtsI (penicillin-binding protein 3)